VRKIDKSIELSGKKSAKIKVKTDFRDYAAFWERSRTRAAGGNPPDVFRNAVELLRKYDKRGVFLGLKWQMDAGNRASTTSIRMSRRPDRPRETSSVFRSHPTPCHFSSTRRSSESYLRRRADR
jgi:hypothetical protein